MKRAEVMKRCIAFFRKWIKEKLISKKNSEEKGGQDSQINIGFSSINAEIKKMEVFSYFIFEKAFVLSSLLTSSLGQIGLEHVN